MIISPYEGCFKQLLYHIYILDMYIMHHLIIYNVLPFSMEEEHISSRLRLKLSLRYCVSAPYCKGSALLKLKSFLRYSVFHA